MYTYKAEILKIIDGDTIKLNIDLGFRTFIVANCRIFGVNAPEINSKDEEIKLKADEAKDWVENELFIGQIVTIYSKKLDKYGRPLVILEYNMGCKILSLAEELLKNGLAIKLEYK